MSATGPKLSKDRDEILLKFKALIDKANVAYNAFKQSDDGTLPGDKYFQLAQVEFHQSLDPSSFRGQHLCSRIEKDATECIFNEGRS